MISDSRLLVSEYRALLEKTKSDAAVFAVLTVVLTPLFLAGVIAALLFALAFVDLPLIDHLGFYKSFLTGANLTVAFMVASYFLNPERPRQISDDDTLLIIVALVLLCGLLGLSYATPLATTHPSWFWPAYLSLTFGMFASLGHAYQPRDDYYLGLRLGPCLYDDPFTLRDDIDRAHFSLGFVASISNFIFQSYAEIFGSSWLWQKMTDVEISEAIRLLQKISSHDPAIATVRNPAQSMTSANNVIRSLVKLELVTIDRDKVRISLKGREFLGRCMG